MKIKYVRNTICAGLCIVIARLLLLVPVVFAQVDMAKTAQVSTSNADLVAKVAPGEFLPVSTKLSNFGGSKRVDVVVAYAIMTNSGKEIASTSETIAVETTANLVKLIPIPFGTTPGTYLAKTTLTYQGQLAPATTQFSFTVERKILGVFQSDFFLYGGISFLASILLILLGSVLVKRHRAIRFTPLSYANIPHTKRTFYEILSDTIMQMRTRVGDEALVIAANTKGLKIDKETGRVLALTESPTKVIATLVSKYERILGRKVSFSLRKETQFSKNSK